MGFKKGLMVGMGVGYVLGAKAGRQRYEQIRSTWAKVTGSPTVHRATERTKEIAGQQAKSTLHTMQHQVERAGSAVKERLTKADRPDGDEVAHRMRDDQRVDLTKLENPIATETGP